MKRVIFLSFMAVLFLLRISFGQELPRSAFFGAMVSDLNDSSRAALKLSSLKGTHIRQVVVGSSAQKSGFMADDVLVSMDGETIENTNQFLGLLKNHYGGENVKVTYYRKSKLRKTTMTLLPRPMETSDAYDITYSSVKSGANHLRTIITKPKGAGKFPAVLLVGGIGCYSIDNISNPLLIFTKMWVDSLTMNGFVTVRVEKTGMGDSKGMPCSESDFITEKQGYLEGLKQMNSLPYVDKGNTFIAGFSMGGIIGPLIAKEVPVKGIIVYGSAGKNWLEYELDNSLRQATMDNMPADSLDKFMRAEYIRLYGLYVEKKLPQQIIKEHPQTASNFFSYPMRIEYFQQVADVNVRELWMNTDAKVLAMHGASDFVSSASEHALIAETVNRYNSGNATYVEIPNADHWGLYAESEIASKSNQQTGLNPLPLSISIKWLKEIL